MGQSGQSLGDGPEAIQAQGIHRQAAERGHDLHTVGLALAVIVFLELGVAGPVPGVLDRPAVSHMLQQGCGCGSETRDLVTGFFDLLAITPAFAAHRQDRGATGPVIGNPFWCGHSPQGPGEVTATLALAVSGFKHGLAAIAQSITDDLKPLAATVLHCDQEVGATLLEVEEKGRFACSASACTNRPLSSTRSSSSRRAWISLSLSVA